ncbi:unnamed protein product [Heterobilharzia americana]|nr:unnamed protein product [Heterobilharzia americana]CAH8569921.1 unnamed protein product [Heterobilharzia americana]
MMATMTTRSSRCLTPFFECQPHYMPQLVDTGGVNQMRNSYCDWVPVHMQQPNSPTNISHRSLVQLETTLNNSDNNNHQQILQPKSPTLIYATSVNPHRHPIHFRGDSLPIYPNNHLQNSSYLKAFHRIPEEQTEQNPGRLQQQHPLSTYQDISLLQATLRRHNHQSIIMTTHSNPMTMTPYQHPHHHQQRHNRLISTANRNHQYKTLRSSQHQTTLLTTPRLMYSNNLDACNKTKSHLYTPRKDEFECQQLLTDDNRHGVVKVNEYITDENSQKTVCHSHDFNQSRHMGDHTTKNNNNSSSISSVKPLGHLNKTLDYQKFSTNSHEHSTNQMTTHFNYHSDVIHIDEVNVDNDDCGCNTEAENDSRQFKCVSSSSSSLPVLVSMNHIGRDSNNAEKFTNSQRCYPQSPPTNLLMSTQSDASKYTYKTLREASFV